MQKICNIQRPALVLSQHCAEECITIDTSCTTAEENMSARGMIHVRVDDALKDRATKVFAEMGLSISEAIRVFLTRSVKEEQFPFPLGAQTKPRLKPSQALEANREAIRRIVSAHHATNPRVFGSVLSGLDTLDSDLDIVVDSIPGMTLFELCAVRHELCETLGVPVDVVTSQGLPEKIRASVLKEAQKV
jgi:addiction module RelB/DinJ family antitoxin